MITIKTWQDLQALGDNEKDRMDFVRTVIAEHKGSKLYRQAVTAKQYYRGLNVTIMNYCKFVRDAYGKAIPDVWSPNHKIPCHYYKYLINQAALTLLGNGVSFAKKDTKEKLGSLFDETLIEIFIDALNDSVGYGFVDKDKVTHFNALEFAALQDEETSAIRAGVRFWQIDADKPLRATLYEEDGFTEYIQRKGKDMEILAEKRPYVIVVQKSDISETEIVDGWNYPTFPIVPLYNVEKMSELEGSRELHDAMDLMLSGLVNNVDSGEIIYWLLKNSNGMDQPSMNQLLQTLHSAHIASIDNEDDLTAHSPQVHFEASKEALDQLRRQIFDNHMGFDPKSIVSGAVTATQIEAAYEPLNQKCSLLESKVAKFIVGVLAVLDIDDKPTFNPDFIINRQESVNTIVAAGDNLPQTYKTRKILEILGDIDKTDEVLAEMDAAESVRFTTENEDEEPEGAEPAAKTLEV